MAQWIEFKRDHDYHHDSRAVTAYKKGNVVYAPKHILENLPADVYEETENPKLETDEGERVFLTDSDG